MVMKENDDSTKTSKLLRNALGDKIMAEYAKIMQTDANFLLEKVSKELKLTDYTLSRVVTSGTDHFIKLAVTTQEKLTIYRERIAKSANKMTSSEGFVKPFTRVEIIDQNPIQCLV